MRRTLAAIIVLAVCAGCVTAVKQAYYTATGPQGSYLIISVKSGSDLERYKTIEVVHFGNNIPSFVGQFLVDAVQEHITQDLMTSRYFAKVTAVPEFAKGATETPTLVIRGTILDVTSDKVPGQKLLDSNYLLASVDLVDKATGEVIVQANLRGVVKSVAESGETPLADGMGHAAKKLFKELLHKTDKED